MINLLVIILTIAIAIAIPVLAWVTQMARFTLASIGQILRFIVTVIVLICAVQIVVVFIFSPTLSSYFPGLDVSEADLIKTTITIGVLAIPIVLFFGKSSAFKLYGTISVLINCTIAILMVLLLHGSSSQTAGNITRANNLIMDASSTFSVYLTSINLSIFLLYGYDKVCAWGLTKLPRVPEWILHWHSILGGSLGAFFAQSFFSSQNY